MPMYEYYCDDCENIVAEIRRIKDRDKPLKCEHCSTARFRVVSVPSMHVWATSREFPNLRKEGDGKMSFDSKTDYETYLKANHVAEYSHDAPVKRPHGNKVIATYG